MDGWKKGRKGGKKEGREEEEGRIRKLFERVRENPVRVQIDLRPQNKSRWIKFF